MASTQQCSRYGKTVVILDGLVLVQSLKTGLVKLERGIDDDEAPHLAIKKWGLEELGQDDCRDIACCGTAISEEL